jgi:hypothetical protein
MPRKLTPCPSWGAYQRHLDAGEPTCDDCREMARQRSEKQRGGPRPRVLQPCGTPAAWQRHMKAGEPVCEPCRVAHNAYQNEYRASRRRERAEWARARTVAMRLAA